MKRLFKFVLTLGLGLAVFLIIMQRVGLANIEQAFALFWGREGLLLIALSFVFVLLGILKWQIILKSYGFDFKFKQLMPLWLSCFSISYLTPFAVFGGEIFRIYFTRDKFPQLPLKKNMASVACDKILDATVFFTFLIFGLLVFAFYGRFPSSAVGIGVLISAGFFFGLLALFYFKRLKKQSALEWLAGIFGIKERLANGKNGRNVLLAEKEVFQFFSLKSRAFWQAFLLTFLRYSVYLLKCFLLVFFLTNQFAFFRSAAVFGFATLATLTPLPATLGSLELGEGVAFRALGFNFNIGAVFSIVWRNADLIIVLFGLGFLLKISFDTLQKKFFRLFQAEKR